MNILFICNEYPPTEPGGIGRFTSRISEWLSSRGHHVIVVGFYKYLNQQVYEKKHGVEIWRLPITGTKYGGKIELFATRLRLRFFIKKITNYSGIQIIEGPDYQGSLWLLPGGIPRICRIHSPRILLRRKVGSKLTRGEVIEDWGAQNADHFIAVSEYAKIMAKNFWKSICNKSITVIPNPISDCFFDDELSENGCSGHETSNTLVFSGSIASHKGVPELIEAWRIVRERYPDMKLEIYGKPGNSTQILKDAINEAKGTISWYGPVDEAILHSAFKSSSLGIFPSHFETEGMAAKEAAASGIPIVVSDIPPYKELFNDAPGVFYFEPKNIMSLSKAILDAIDSVNCIDTDTLVRKMRNHNMERIGQMNVEFYQEVICQCEKTHY